MEKPHRISEIYAYTVCVVAIITVLICVPILVSALLDLGDPMHSGWTPPGAPSLVSFDNYKADILKSTPKDVEAVKAVYVPDDQTLHAMYEAAKNDKIQGVRHDSNRQITIASLLILLCIGLFGTHWRWARKLAKAEAQ